METDSLGVRCALQLLEVSSQSTRLVGPKVIPGLVVVIRYLESLISPIDEGFFFFRKVRVT